MCQRKRRFLGNSPYRELVSTLNYQKARHSAIIETSAVISVLWQCYASLVVAHRRRT